MSPQPDNPRSLDEAEPPHRWQALAVCGLLLLAVGLIYGQTAAFQFVNLDDNICVTDNPHVTGGLSADDLSWAFTHPYAGCWVPLTWISHMLDWQLYGDWAGGHHRTNVLLHAATTLLLFLTLRRMTGRLWPSALAAALFAVHPLRVESVAWVTERKDVLSGLFFVLVLWVYAGYARSRVRETHQNQRIRHTPCAADNGTRSVPDTLTADALHALYGYLAVIAFFALGLMAKPSVVTLPFVLLLLDYWPLGRITIKPRPAVAPAKTRDRWSRRAN